MESVINQEKMKEHSISKYKFKVFAMGVHDEQEEEIDGGHEVSAEQNEQKSDEVSLSRPENSSSRDEMVVSLLSKTEDVTSNFIKIQMKYEEREEGFKAELESARKEAYEEGVSAGRLLAEQALVQNKSDGMEQFSASVKTLEDSAEKFENALAGVKEELLQAALDIAKEVIGIEIAESSNTIAQKLASQLITELQGASKVTLRVNPADHGPLSENLGSLTHVTVVSDSAVSKGGVIAISDVGNIDSEVMKRYERVKRAALSD